MLLKILSVLLCLITAYSQQKQSVTVEDYKRAEKFLRNNTSSLVIDQIIRSKWSEDNKLLYRKRINGGFEFYIVDPVKKKKDLAFNHIRMAKALSKEIGKKYTANKLPFRSIKFTGKKNEVEFRVRRKNYICNLNDYSIKAKKKKKNEISRYSRLSPDGKKVAFIRDYNLWVRFLESGKEKQLTKDGIEDYGYATNNAGWVQSKVPVLTWSPKSDKIATFRHDSRKVEKMYLVSTKVGHPKLKEWKYPLPGDKHIFMIERVVAHLDSKLTKLKMNADAHRSTTTDHIADWGGNFLDLEWSADAKQLSFVSSSRDHKIATLRIADPNSGEVRDIIKEKTKTFYESGYNHENWNVLNETNEVIWYSQRDNWGHLYLYDLNTGKLKQQITKGKWNVLKLIHMDLKKRTLYFIGSGKEKGDPYFQYFYSINMDGSELKLLSPEHGHHSIKLSENKKFFLDTYSTPVKPSISVLRSINGDKILDLEKADITKLKDYGWLPPIPIISFDSDERWNFIFLNGPKLSIILTDKQFQADKIIKKDISKFNIQSILGLHVTNKVVEVAYTSGNKRFVQILQIHKYSEQIVHKRYTLELHKNATVLQYVSYGNKFLVFYKNEDSPNLQALDIRSIDTCVSKSFSTKLNLAQRWESIRTSYPTNHSYIVKDCRTETPALLSAPIKIYPRTNKICLTLDEPYKTHVVTLDLSSNSTKELEVHTVFPKNIPFSSNITNSIILKDELHQVMLGKWGLSVQRHNLLTDSTYAPFVLRTADYYESDQVECFQQSRLSTKIAACSFGEFTSEASTKKALGITCRESKGRITYSICHYEWQQAEFQTANIHSVPKKQSIKLNGIKYELPNAMSTSGHSDYFMSRHIKGQWATIVLSRSDNELATPQPTEVYKPLSTHDIDQELNNSVVFRSYSTFVMNCSQKFYGFYIPSKKAFTILSL